MSQPTICLSLAPNLRCIALDQLKSEAFIIPPAVELIICIFFLIVSKRGPDRLYILLAADGISYFIMALFDMLSHIAPAARKSLSIFKSLDIFLGSVSFVPLIIYSFYLYFLSRRAFIPDLPQRLQAIPVYSLATLMVLVVAFNEVASFADVTDGSLLTEYPLTISPVYDEHTSWLPWSQLSLATFTAIQFLFFLLAFYRLGKAFLDQKRIEISQSNEHHFFNGIVWITVGLEIGVIETLAGFAQADFTVVLARRILRLISRTVLIVGVFKGLDTLENFENLANELRGRSHFSRRLSHLFGANSRSLFRRASQLHLSPSLLSQHEKHTDGRRVTVHYERDHAPVLQIRFSGLDFPSQALLADGMWTGRSSVLIPAIDSRTPYKGTSISAKLPVAPETRRAESAVPGIQGDSTAWYPPAMIRHIARRKSGETISDNLSIVRDLELRFPNLPPRVTGKYRGSILGHRYEEDLFPVVGVSRESSLRKRDSVQSTTEAGSSTGLRSSGLIKRKPAPPLLANPVYIVGNRPLSTWGGLAQNTVQYPTVSPTTPCVGEATHSPCESSDGETQSPESARGMTPRNLFKRISKAMSETSIRSAEWLASARPHQSLQPQFTTADIEMYRNRVTVPPSPRCISGGPGLMADRAGEIPVHRNTRKSAEDAFYAPGPGGPRLSVGHIVAIKTPSPTQVDHELGRERVLSSHGSVSIMENFVEQKGAASQNMGEGAGYH